jgi:hypothetical protein
MGRFFRNNGLTIVLMMLFAASVVGMALTGLSAFNEERAKDGYAALTMGQYLVSGQFMSALYENWESEFLQMGTYVVLTAYLYQRGSPESRDLHGKVEQDRDPARDRNKPDAPWPVRAGGIAARAYAHSLGATLFLLFLLSFALHWVNSARAQAEEAVLRGETLGGLVTYLGDAQLWFESFQNWQSEFLSTAVLVVLAIFLREKGSPESKAVGDPHDKTGA